MIMKCLFLMVKHKIIWIPGTLQLKDEFKTEANIDS